jgi:hypothetical protein
LNGRGGGKKKMNLNDPLFPSNNYDDDDEYSVPPPLYYSEPTIAQKKSRKWVTWLSRGMNKFVPNNNPLLHARWVLHLCVLSFFSFAIHLLYTFLPAIISFACIGIVLHFTGHFIQIFNPRQVDSSKDSFLKTK